METDYSGEQSYTQATPPDPSYDTSPIGSDVIQAGTSNNFGLSFADDAQATADRSNVLSQASFNEAMGITALNPFGNNNFFTQAFGIPADALDYSGMGIDLDYTSNLAYDRYRNPLTKQGTLRSGLSAGERTVLGDVIKIDKPMSPTETLMRAGVGAFMPGPVGLILSQLGTSQKAIAPMKQGVFGDIKETKGVNYDPTLDPKSPQYKGPTGILGEAGRELERLMFGGAQPVREGIGALQNVLN